jgi:hypothetical protein
VENRGDLAIGYFKTMTEARIEDFAELVGLLALNTHPIMPQPTWGQDAAFLGFVIDRLTQRCVKLSDELGAWQQFGETYLEAAKEGRIHAPVGDIVVAYVKLLMEETSDG